MKEAADRQEEEEAWGGAGEVYRVRVSLERFYSDERARCYMSVCGTRPVRSLARRLRIAFSLPRALILLSRGHMLPPDEPLAVLRPDDPVEVIPANATEHHTSKANITENRDCQSAEDKPPSSRVVISAYDMKKVDEEADITDGMTAFAPEQDGVSPRPDLASVKRRALEMLEQCGAGPPARRRRVRRRRRAAPVEPVTPADFTTPVHPLTAVDPTTPIHPPTAAKPTTPVNTTNPVNPTISADPTTRPPRIVRALSDSPPPPVPLHNSINGLRS